MTLKSGPHYWTERSIEILRSELQKDASYPAIIKAIAEAGEYRFSKTAIRSKIKALGLFRDRRNVWSAEATQLIKDEIPRGTSAAIIAKMIKDRFGPSYTRNAVISRALRMGLRSGPRVKITRPPRQPKTNQPKVPPTRVSHPKPELVMIHEAPPMPKEGHDWYSEGGHWPLAPPRGLCQYPYGNLPGPTAFCGEQALDLTSYCAYHYQRCYVPTSGVRRPIEQEAAA